jgi:hypothetical protein
MDPLGGKHYQLKTYHLNRLVTHVEKGGVLDGHRDVLETVREEFYMEEHTGGRSTVAREDIS